MLATSKLVYCGFLILFTADYVNTQPRRLRVKTISNITADATEIITAKTLIVPDTTTESTTQVFTENIETTTTARSLRRRLRPTRPTPTTTTEKTILLQTSTETARRNRGRVTWQKVSVGNVTEGTNVTTGGNLEITVKTPERRVSHFRNSQPTVTGEIQSPTTPTAQRNLVKPRRNTTSVYNFETGKIDRTTNDLNVSTTNQIDKQNEVPEIIQSNPVHDQLPKKYSSRYSKPQPIEAENEEQVLDSDDIEEVESEAEAEEEEEDTKGLLYDGDYRELGSEEPDDNEGAYNENVIDEKSEGDGASESLKKGGKGGEAKKSEKGGGEEHHSDAKAVKGHKDQKAYKGKHHFTKGAKGFHDKEVHKGEYKDEKGSKKGHKSGGGHFESGHHGEKGKKEAEHAEKEEYKKGHSTRGGHVIHKKDEYEKKMEFFDESNEDGHGEKFGAYFESHQGKKGGHKKGGHKDGSSAGKHHAKKGHFAKGSHAYDDKGHDKKDGKESKYGHHETFGKKGSKKDNKSYHFEHGSGKPKGGDDKKKSLVAEENEGHQSYVNEPKEEVAKENEELKVEEVSSDDNGEAEEESKEVKQISKEEKNQPIKPKNAEYMNEDGPTSYYTNKKSISPTGNSLDGNLHPKKNFNSNLALHSPTRKGKFMTEEELREDKESESGLKVFNPLHEESDHGELSRSYRVVEPNVEEEPNHEESRPFISRVNVHSGNFPVNIVAMYKLPPMSII